MSIVLLFSTLVTVGQTKSTCNCPSNTIAHNSKPDLIFKFSNGKSVGLCGYSENQNKQQLFSEFIIYQCGQKIAIAEWGATRNCTVEQKNDTLIIQELFLIANGKNLSLRWEKFYKTKFYWDSDKLIDASYYLKNLKKYSPNEIKKVMTEFEQLHINNNKESILLIAHRLFWAYVSGNKKAGKYLEDFENRLGSFDGANAQDFHDLISTYKHYKTK